MKRIITILLVLWGLSLDFVLTSISASLRHTGQDIYLFLFLIYATLPLWVAFFYWLIKKMFDR